MDTDLQLAELVDNGVVVVPDVLSTEQVAGLNAAIERILDEEGQPDGLNMFQAAFRSPEVLALVEHEGMLELMVNLLGYNLQLQSSVLSVRRAAVDVDEASADGPDRIATFAGRKLPKEGAIATRLNWHRDGPSPRFPRIDMFSAKAAFILSDLSQPDHGNTKVIPGSHKDPSFRPPDGDPESLVPGERQILGKAGDGYIFAQNLWHAAPANVSSIERRVVFIGYGSCWTRPLDYDKAPAELLEGASPILRQLLGEVGPSVLHHYIPDFTPLDKYWRGGDVVHSYA